MDKLFAALKLLLGVLLGITALATAVNLVLISMRPETISVVNTIIGQGLLVVCLLALARMLLKKGMQGLRGGASGQDLN